jgi:hypothetical protein
MRRVAVPVGLAVAFTAFALGSVISVRSARPDSVAGPKGIDKVVVFGIPRLTFSAVRPSVMPNLVRLSDAGAIAGANVRTRGDRPSVGEAYASLGAGNRVSTGAVGVTAYDADAPLEGGTAGEVTARRSRTTFISAVVVPRMAAAVNDADVGDAAGPGALAEALGYAGRRTAVVANADTRSVDGTLRPAAPAALAAADAKGLVDDGTVDGSLLRSQLHSPYGVTADVSRFEDEVFDALSRSDLVVVDPGETLRAETYLPTQSPSRARRSRVDALRDTDAVLGRIAGRIDPHTLLIVVGVTPARSSWSITPVVFYGGGVPPGYLHSSSTHRPALVTLTDLAPTVLDALGEDVPAGMIGSPLRYRPGPASFHDIAELDDLLASRGPVDAPMTITFIVVQSVVYVLAVVVLTRVPRARWSAPALSLAILACGAWPLCTFLVRASPALASMGYGTFALTWVMALVLAGVALRFRAHPLDPLIFICGATVAVIVGDLATGAWLEYGGFFGYAPNSAPRYTGIGNAAFALLSGATVVLCAGLVARSRRATEAWWVAVTVAAVVVFADGVPWMGADVGGMLSTVPVFGLTLWALRGRRIRWQTLAVAAAGAAVVLAGAVGLEALRDPDQRTHIGRFFLGQDGVDIRDTFQRKWSANTRVLRQSVWAWLVPVISGFSLYVLVVVEGWRRFLPRGSPERTGVVAALAMGTAGWLVNDSGVVVLALALVYLGPYVWCLAGGAGALASPAGAPADDEVPVA